MFVIVIHFRDFPQEGFSNSMKRREQARVVLQCVWTICLWFKINASADSNKMRDFGSWVSLTANSILGLRKRAKRVILSDI